MKNVSVHDSSLSEGTVGLPVCSGCGHIESVAPAVVEQRAPFFCTHCCNYLDKNGAISA